MARYPAPFGSDFRVSRALLEPKLTADNYQARMHDLLYVEEIAQFANISRSVVLSVVVAYKSVNQSVIYELTNRFS